MRIIHIILLFFLINLQYLSATEIGVNLSGQGAFVNMMNHASRILEAESYDENGWPKSDFKLVLMDGRPAQEWNQDIDDPEEYRIDYSGTYKGSFYGKADLRILWSEAYIENMIWDAESNTSYFDLVIPGPPKANHAFIYLEFTNTMRETGGILNTGVKDIKVMRPGYNLNTEKIFTDDYIALCKAADFSCFRFYTVQNIWGGEPEYPGKTLWDNRKTPMDATQQPMIDLNGKRDGWSWEYIIELANILNKDIWICIHMSCDSNYVRSLAQLLKEQLNPNINIYVENSNEVWSPTHMTHGPYNKAQADDYGISFDENYARRSVELSDIFAEVFGTGEINNRIRVILAGQHAYRGRHNLHLDYINNTFGPPKNYIYALSSALYFGSTKADGSVEDINSGMIEDINEQINDSESSFYRKAHIDIANDWDLPGGCTSYEGGPHLPAGGVKDNLGNQILAHRTEEMKNILIKNYTEGWSDIGGGLALHFTLAGSYNRYGCWGLTDDPSNPDRNYKMQAMRDMLGDWQNSEGVVVNNHGVFFSIVPNPAKNILRINFELQIPDKVTIVLYNSLSAYNEIVFDAFADAGSRTLITNIDHLANGVYFVQFIVGANSYFAKIMVIN